jgi:hypothetical protein
LSRRFFWHSSLRAVFAELAIARTRARDEHNREIRLAWMIAGLTRAKKLPTLKRLLDPGPLPRQTPGQMQTVLHALGIKPRPLSPEAKAASRILQ